MLLGLTTISPPVGHSMAVNYILKLQADDGMTTQARVLGFPLCALSEKPPVTA